MEWVGGGCFDDSLVWHVFGVCEIAFYNEQPGVGSWLRVNALVRKFPDALSGDFFSDKVIGIMRPALELP